MIKLARNLHCSLMHLHFRGAMSGSENQMTISHWRVSRNQQDDCYKGNVAVAGAGCKLFGFHLLTTHKILDLLRGVVERMEGLVSDPDKGWRVLYTDSENDVMVAMCIKKLVKPWKPPATKTGHRLHRSPQNSQSTKTQPYPLL
ncbi:hypothetical protein V6N12_052572 [Hibiscus sabdariffa]|uniref:Uncharacterized protein n=1 Tax=Hibiscus sabdariffa TaxID=183260 RepID=A0ABR2C218_9ROSI